MNDNEAENQAEEASMEQKAAQRTAGALGNLETMVKNTGGAMPLGDLEKMGAESVGMLSGEATEADARDAAKMKALNGAANSATDASRAEVTSEKARFQQTRQ